VKGPRTKRGVIAREREREREEEREREQSETVISAPVG